MTTKPVASSDGATARPTVTVVGLGEMGSALASAFIDSGHRTTVWNRSPGKADALVAKGANASTTAEEGVAASELVVVNVKGNDVAQRLLESAGDALPGRVVVNLTDGPSHEAVEMAQWVADNGADYLHGQIITIAPGIGHPDAVVFYGGPEEVFDRYRPSLAVLSGHQTYVGTNPGASSLYGMAVHDIMWGTLNGYLHAAALLRSEGVAVKRFLDEASTSVSAISSFFGVLADEIDRRDHAVPFGALKHHLASIDDVVTESRARGIDDELPSYTRRLVARAIDDGHADDSYSRLVDQFGKRES